MQIENIDIKQLKPYQNNPRKNDKAIDKVAESIKLFGFRIPVILDKNDVIICGHTRIKAAEKLGIKIIPCIYADDLTDEQIKAFRLIDNKTSEYAQWDFEKLDLEIKENNLFDFLDGFNLDFDMGKLSFDELEKGIELKEKYEVIVNCNNSAEQEQIFYKLIDEGYDVKISTM